MKGKFQLLPLETADIAEFKREMQNAFQTGYEQEFGPCEEPVLPEEDIDRSLTAEGSAAYAARIDGIMEGGAIVHTALRANVPVYAFKAISDVAGKGCTTEQYLNNAQRALQAMEEALPAIVEAL